MAVLVRVTQAVRVPEGEPLRVAVVELVLELEALAVLLREAQFVLVEVGVVDWEPEAEGVLLAEGEAVAEAVAEALRAPVPLSAGEALRRAEPEGLPVCDREVEAREEAEALFVEVAEREAGGERVGDRVPVVVMLPEGLAEGLRVAAGEGEARALPETEAVAEGLGVLEGEPTQVRVVCPLRVGVPEPLAEGVGEGLTRRTDTVPTGERVSACVGAEEAVPGAEPVARLEPDTVGVGGAVRVPVLLALTLALSPRRLALPARVALALRLRGEGVGRTVPEPEALGGGVAVAG